jgi:uncharacterized DUF497 family protein
VFEWDPGKARTNAAKHGVSFGEAATIFADPNGLDGPDLRHSSLELRRLRIGRALTGRILMVAYTGRSSADGEEVVRIISARRASRKERSAYRGTT